MAQPSAGRRLSLGKHQLLPVRGPHSRSGRLLFFFSPSFWQLLQRLACGAVLELKEKTDPSPFPESSSIISFPSSGAGTDVGGQGGGQEVGLPPGQPKVVKGHRLGWVIPKEPFFLPRDREAPWGAHWAGPERPAPGFPMRFQAIRCLGSAVMAGSACLCFQPIRETLPGKGSGRAAPPMPRVGEPVLGSIFGGAPSALKPMGCMARREPERLGWGGPARPRPAGAGRGRGTRLSPGQGPLGNPPGFTKSPGSSPLSCEPLVFSARTTRCVTKVRRHGHPILGSSKLQEGDRGQTVAGCHMCWYGRECRGCGTLRMGVHPTKVSWGVSSQGWLSGRE